MSAKRTIRCAVLLGTALTPLHVQAGWNPFKDIEHAAHDIGHAVEKGVGDAGKAIEQGAHDGGHAIEKGVGDGGKAIEKGAHDGGHAVETAVGQTGHVVENAAHDVGHYAEKHPLEFALAVALVAGGGYLLVFQDYVLTLKIGEATVAVVHGGVASGGITAATGAGAIAAGASTAGNSPGNGTTMETTVGRPTAAPPAPQPSDAQPNGRSGPPVLEASTPNASAKLSEVDARLKYGMGVLDWIERENLVEAFKPDDYLTRLSPAEAKLLDAIDEVGRIPDSVADAANRKQQEERRDLPRKLYRDAVFDVIKLKPPTEIARKALTTLRDAAISETVLGDGQAAARMHQTRLLHEKLDRFLDKRFETKNVSIIPKEMPPSGPVIKAN